MNDIGILTIAQNSGHDYLSMAYLQCLMLKKNMPNIPYCVIVDQHTLEQITDDMRKSFDFIQVLENDYAVKSDWKLANEPQVYALSPFEHTLKLESDLLINKNIEHWFDILKTKDIVMSVGSKNFLGQKATSRFYRKIFDENLLPDVYTGMMYFKKSEFSESFFNLAQDIFLNWDILSKEFKYGTRTTASTDVVYAVVAKILGVEKCTIPSLDFFQFIHMKQRINDWVFDLWEDVVILEIDDQIRIANTNIYDPIHYQVKNLFSPEHYKQKICKT
jgi:hypothetical protein